MSEHIVQTCYYCSSQDITRGKWIIANGSYQVRDQCNHCGKNANGPGINIKHSEVEEIEYLPVLGNYVDPEAVCSVCGSNQGVEWHHFAPQAMFGHDAWNWPMHYLCLDHHRQWHYVIEEYYRVKFAPA